MMRQILVACWLAAYPAVVSAEPLTCAGFIAALGGSPEVTEPYAVAMGEQWSKLQEEDRRGEWGPANQTDAMHHPNRVIPAELMVPMLRTLRLKLPSTPFAKAARDAALMMPP
jgi:hypothetical protein